MSRFLISAAHKSSGKTTLSIGLCAALHAKGLSVQAYKKGPDFIDPMWLAQASGHPCYNLDFYMMSRDEILDAYYRHIESADVGIIEGNKGLYDGLDLDGSNSNAALAQLLNVPVILIVDARGMTRGVAPLILGYQAFDRNIRIAGVILNRLGGLRHESKLRAVIEHYTDIPVLGAVQNDDALQIVERHLGLMPNNESLAAERKIRTIAARIAEQVDLDRLLQKTIPQPEATTTCTAYTTYKTELNSVRPHFRIGLMRDRAFGFYYADDLEALNSGGAKIIPVDALKDTRLPELDGLIIGGGFPELFLKELEANTGLRDNIRQVIENGLPVYAECGGLMYLSRSIRWNEETHQMVGAIPGDIVMHAKPVGRGYVRLRETGLAPWNLEKDKEAIGETEICAHEFHYSDMENLSPDTKFAYSVTRGHGLDGQYDGVVYRNLLASYTHLRATQNFNWVQRFLALVARHASTGKTSRQAAA
jgi:cobyrinic acid a,c-diamide synthase